LETIEESRENATIDKSKKKALEDYNWHKPNVNIFPSGEHAIALPPAGKRKKALKLLVQAEMRSSTSPAKKNPTTYSK
jgi:hypothetical protein